MDVEKTIESIARQQALFEQNLRRQQESSEKYQAESDKRRAELETQWAARQKEQAAFDLRISNRIEFIVEQQAIFEANFREAEKRSARAEVRLDRIEAVVAQNNRLVAKLAVAGRRLRSDVRRHERTLAEHDRRHAQLRAVYDRNMAEVTKNLAEVTRKLNALASLRGRRNGRGNSKPSGG